MRIIARLIHEKRQNKTEEQLKESTAAMRQFFPIHLRVLPALLFAVVFACAVTPIVPSIQTGFAESGAAPSIEKMLDEIGLPTIYIHTADGKNPTFEKAEKPEGMPGATITNNEYVKGFCQITNLDSGKSFSSPMKLKVRGNTTARSAGLHGKLPYKLVLKKKVDLFGNGHMEKRFVLLASPGHKINTLLSFLIGQYCGMEWTPECRYVNVVLNDDYRGIYLLVTAVDGTMRSEHIGPNGFMIECDIYWWKESAVFETEGIGQKMAYVIKYPAEEVLTETRFREIREYMETVDKDICKHKSSDLIDEDSFIAWIMTRDITAEVDSVGANIYYYMENFDANNPTRFKLHMGPLWDFDNTFTSKRDGQWSAQRRSHALYFHLLFKNEDFYNKYVDTWHRVSQTLYATMETKLRELIDTEGEAINASRKLNTERWDKPLVLIEDEAKETLAWLKNRMDWIDAELTAEAAEKP